MATSNFLPFNPTEANQLNDAAYLTDATRTGGAGVDAIWPSASANKTLHQVSTGIAALMQMMANKGFTVSDASLSALTTQLSNILTTSDIQNGLQSVAWASILSLNATRYNGFEIGLSGSTSLFISGQVAGQVIVLLFAQDGSGGHAVNYPGNIVGGAQPDQAANTISCQIFKVNAVGTLQALGPNVSVNGMRGLAVNAATLQIAGAAPSGQVLTGDGTHYVPVAAPGYSSGSNAYGRWEQNPLGTILQRGSISVTNSGGTLATGSIIFPITFPTAIDTLVISGGNYAQGSNPDAFTFYYVDLTTSGATAIARGAVNIGGSGMGAISNTVPITWIAIGY